MQANAPMVAFVSDTTPFSTSGSRCAGEKTVIALPNR